MCWGGQRLLLAFIMRGEASHEEIVDISHIVHALPSMDESECDRRFRLTCAPIGRRDLAQTVEVLGTMPQLWAEMARAEQEAPATAIPAGTLLEAMQGYKPIVFPFDTVVQADFSHPDAVTIPTGVPYDPDEERRPDGEAEEGSDGA